MDKNNDMMIQLLKKAQAQYSKSHFVVAVPGFISKKFVGYCSMKDELELSLAYLNLIRSQHDKIIKTSLTVSIISLYGKCYTDATKNSCPKLEPDMIFKEEMQLRKTHDYLLDLRHQFVAHRGKTMNVVGIAYMVLPKSSIHDKNHLRFSQLKHITFSDIDLSKIEKLLKFVSKALEAKIQKSGQKVYDAMFNLFTAEQLTLMSINNME